MPQPIRVPNQTWQELDGVQEPFSIRRFQGVSKLNPMSLEPGYATNLYNLSPSSYPSLSVRGGLEELLRINPNVRYDVIDGHPGIIVESGTKNLFPSNLSQSFASPWTSEILNGTYTVSVRSGTGALELSGGAVGTVAVGQTLTFTVTNAPVTFTPVGGTPSMCQLEAKPYATTWHLGRALNSVWLDSDGGSGVAAGATVYSTGTATGSYSIDSSVHIEGRSASQKIQRTGGGASDAFGIKVTYTNVSPPVNLAVILRTIGLTWPARAVVRVEYFNQGELVSGSAQYTNQGQDWFTVEIRDNGTRPYYDTVVAYVYIDGGNGYCHVQGIYSEGGGVRSPEIFKVPSAGVFGGPSGLVDCTVRLLRSPGYIPQYVFDAGGLSNKNLVVYVGTDGKVRAEIGTGNSTTTLVGSTVIYKDNDYRVTVLYSGTTVRLLVNDVVEASANVSPFIEPGEYLYLGSKADGTHQLDGMFKTAGPLAVWAADFALGSRMNISVRSNTIELAYSDPINVTYTTKDDFDLGTNSGTDTAVKSGSVLLARQS